MLLILSNGILRTSNSGMNLQVKIIAGEKNKINFKYSDWFKNTIKPMDKKMVIVDANNKLSLKFHFSLIKNKTIAIGDRSSIEVEKESNAIMEVRQTLISSKKTMNIKIISVITVQFTEEEPWFIVNDAIIGIKIKMENFGKKFLKAIFSYIFIMINEYI
ncbi:hypothetical protein C4B25_00760 [Mycoplasma todarodis]|uniref:Uncharacterized protein n=2 Tax=Mycoplasma todarodis TaxID=1937191 RepID=A0A4R0XXR9_9MOLU|nr:hypothetical protein C4B25_00760 [Mycoplasma todarodis]